MELLGYELDLEPILAELKAKKPKLIGLQFPDGLRDYYADVARLVQDATGAAVVVSADPSYGSCDLADDELAKVKADALIHFAHTQMPHMGGFERLPVYFVAARSTHDVMPAVRKAVALLAGPRVGVLGTTQHLHTLPAVAAFLKTQGFQAVLNDGDARIAGPGQVLGCNYTAAPKDADSYLYVGSGSFHPLGLALNTSKPIICADPYNEEVRNMEAERQRFLKQRMGAIAAVQDARTWGVLASSKQGQLRWNMAQALQRRLERKGRRAFLLLLKQFAPEYLINFRHLDAFVSTACPRVAIDDYARYPKPLVTPIELEIALGERRFEDYRLDEIYGTSI